MSEATVPTDVLTPTTRHAPVALKLVVISRGPDFGRELVLERGTYRVGKGSANELVLADEAVSRTHLLLEVLPHAIRVTDNGSTNGSSCDGVRFTTVEARAGQSFRVGSTDLKLLPLPEARPAMPLSKGDRFGDLIGHSAVMRGLFTMLERIAATDATVLIHGESGTGKELCARSLHRASGRSSGPYVVCDLAAVAPTLFESELFGHLRGSFTNASSDRVGAFEAAHGGTLFLDEIGELPLEIQPRLLRVLESRQVKRVGSSEYRDFDVRIIAATNKNLEEEVAAGRFREDLLYRLSVVEVTLAPLRERREDIPLLIDALLSAMNKPATTLTAETRVMLADYPWPGNVRELRNVVERVISMGSDIALPRDDQRARPDVSLPFKEAKDRLVASFERDYLVELLRRCDGNVARAARESGLHRVHLHRLLKKYDVND